MRADHPDTGIRPFPRIEADPSERKQWLFETDHLKAQGRLRERTSLRRNRIPGLRADARVRRTDGPRKRLAGIWGTSPALLRGTAIRI